MTAAPGDAPEVLGELRLPADRLKAIRKDPTGGYIVAGIGPTGDLALPNAYVARLGASGSLLWGKVLHRSQADEASSIAVAQDGYVMVGVTGAVAPCGLDCIGSGASADVYIVKLSPDGDVLWDRAIGGAELDAGRDIVASPAGGYVFAGQSRSSSNGFEDAYVAALDESGAVLWERRFGGPGGEIAYSIANVTGGGYIVAGKSGPSASTSIHLILLDASGDPVWERLIQESDSNLVARCVIELEDGNFAICGNSSRAAYVLVADREGAVLWDRKLKPAQLNALVQSETGALLTAGIAPWEANRHDAYLARLDLRGETVQEFTLGIEEREELPFAIAADGSGGYWLAGSRWEHVSGSEDAYLLHVGLPNGVFLRGDADGNGTVEAADALGILGFLFLRGTQPACLDALDARDDGTIDVVDAVGILVRLFQGGSMLPPPTHALGVDPTPDALRCDER